jgi:L,D-transpeptidase ErfK/SrfK
LIDEKLTPNDWSLLPSTAAVIYRRRFKIVARKRVGNGRQYANVFSCPCSIGMVGFETPAGSYLVLEKQLDPPWRVPTSYWVPDEMKGKTIPSSDPSNPLKGAWIRLTDDGIGIHGTASFPLGKKASHGCIRVKPSDAIALHGLLELASPVTVV